MRVMRCIRVIRGMRVIRVTEVGNRVIRVMKNISVVRWDRNNSGQLAKSIHTCRSMAESPFIYEHLLMLLIYVSLHVC
jgi:hypothetical protein